VTIRLLSYNIRRGGIGREPALAQVIRASGADLVVLQEATRPEVVERLAADTQMVAWGSQRGQSLGYLSRLPLAERAWHRPAGSRHAFLDLQLEGIPVRIVGVHLSAVHAAWTERRRVRELRALLDGVRHHPQGLHVLAGDFNTLAPGELLDIRKLPHRLRALVWLSGGRIRWRTIATLLSGNYADGYRALHPQEAGLTFPTWDPHVRLDYVFLPAGRIAALVGCRVETADPAPQASDHFPLLAEIVVP
jgi:endonuclease/exonuclease/phosphatase family metal-dependent hydrolase